MAGKADLVIRFLRAARSLADQGLSREAIIQFAKNEFGEIGELFQKQIDNIFKPKQGIKNIKMKDPDFDDTVVEMQFDEFGPFNPKDPLKNLKKQTEGIDTIKPKKNPDDPEKFYTGGMVDVEPNLSDIGHGSDALMARTRLVSPNGQATTSTGLNYLLAEDNDNIRVPFQDGLNLDKKIEKMLRKETEEDKNFLEEGKKELEKKVTEQGKVLSETKPTREKFLPGKQGDKNYQLALDAYYKTEKGKKERETEMFQMVKEFQKFKRNNPNSRIPLSRFIDIKKKEKELFKNTVLDLAVKYPEKKIINEAGFVDKKKLKETIDKAELDLEISPIDGLTLKRSIDTEGDQSVTSGTFDINNFSFSSPNLEEGILTTKGNFNIGDLNLEGTVDSKDSDILKSGIGFNYNDILKGKLSESDGNRSGELKLDKTFKLPTETEFGYNTMFTPENKKLKNVIDNLNLNLKGNTDFITSDLKPTLSYNDGIFNASIAKSILEGGDTPNLSAGVNYNDFYLKGDDLLSEDRSGLFGYQKNIFDKDNLKFSIGGERNLFDDDYTMGAGLKYTFADGGRIGFSKGKLADAARRQFMKAAGAGAAGLAALKTGLLGFGEKAAPVVEKAVETVQGTPQYFFDLVSKIKMFGKKSKFGPQERVDEYSYTGANGDDYTLTEDIVTGDARIVKDKTGGVQVSEDEVVDGVANRSVMEYKSGKGAADEGTGGALADEYDEYEVKFDMDGTEADADDMSEFIKKEIIEEVSDKTTKTKKAEGGRIGYSKGKAVLGFLEIIKDPKKIREAIDNIFKTGDYKMDAEMAAESLVELNPKAFGNKLYDDLDDKTRMQVYSAVIDDVMGDVGKKIKEKKTDTYRFLKKVFGDSLDDMPDRDPELYTGLKEVVPMFRQKDKAKKKQELIMYMQKYLPHMNDTEIEEFIVGSTPEIEGLSGQLLRLGSGRDYKSKLDMLKEANEKRKLSDLEVTEEMIRKPNASGGLAKMLGE